MNNLTREFVKTAQDLDAVEIFVRSGMVAKEFGVSKFFSAEYSKETRKALSNAQAPGNNHYRRPISQCQPPNGNDQS